MAVYGCALRVAPPLQVTVAEVKYSSLSRSRIGVCSTMLSERLQVGKPRDVITIDS